MATNPQDYLLSFDFANITRQVDQLNTSYAGLGETLKSIADKLTTDLKTIEESSSKIVDNLGFIVQSIKASSAAVEYNTSKALQNYKELEAVTKKISGNLGGFGGGGSGGQGGTANQRVQQEARDGTSKNFSSDMTKALNGLSSQVTKTFDVLPGTLKKSFGDFSKELSNTLQGTFTSLKSSMGGAGAGAATGAGKAAIGNLGTTAALAILALAAFGAQETMRKDAQLGTLTNVAKPAVDAFSAKGAESLKWYADVQEEWRYTAGISIEETNKVMGNFVNMGYKVKQALNVVGGSLKDIEKNVATTSVGLDLVFNKGIGFFAGEIAKAATDFNYTLGESENKLKKLYFMAQRTGSGFEGFITGIMGASQSMKQFGFDIESVAVVSNRVKETYQGMGLESQKAADLAVTGLSALYAGIKNMAGSDEMMAQLFKLKGSPGQNSIEFKQDFNDSLKRFMEGDPKTVFEMTQNLHDVLMDMSKGERYAYVELAKTKAGIDDVSIMRQLFDNTAMFTKPGKLGGLTDKQKQALKDSVKTKSMELTELQKVQQSLIQTLGKIGSHILKAMVALVRVFMDLGKTLLVLPQLIGADEGTRMQILNSLGSDLSSMKDVIFDAFRGIGQELEESGDRPGDIMKILDPTGIGKGNGYDPAAILNKAMPEESAESRRAAATSAPMQVADAISTFLQKEDELEKKVANWISDGIDTRLRAFFGDTTKGAVESLDYVPAKGGATSVKEVVQGSTLRYSASVTTKAEVSFPGKK